MLSLPKLSRMMDFGDDDEYLFFPRQLLYPSSSGTRFGVPFTTNNKYNLHLDLHHFEPQYISVKVDNGMINVNAKYEKNEDGHHVFREYSHKFSMPENIVADQLKCKMNPQGVMQIEAPLKNPVPAVDGHHHIPIEFVKK